MAKLTDFKYARWIGAANLYGQAILVFLLFVGASYFASQYFKRIDLSKDYRYSLSPETVAHLKQLDRPVKIYVTITSDADDNDIESLFNDVRGLLREYAYAVNSSERTLIDVEFVNIYQQRKKANLLADEHGIQQSDLILLVSGDKKRIVFPNELYLTEGRVRKAFLGEKVLTGAILDVASDQQKKLYFLTGHGEMRIDDVHPVRGLSQLADALRHRNIRAESLDLTQISDIPLDADMLLLISPQGPLLPQEEEMLRNYLSNQAGRLLLMLDPNRRHGLDDLFYDWGILVDDVIILDAGPDFLSGGQDLMLRRFIDHDITRTLIDNKIPVMAGFCRSIRPDPGRPLTDSLQVQPLIATSEQSWGERNFSEPGKYDPGIDLPGPLSVAVISERQVSSQLAINIPGGKLIAFGTSDFVSNNRIGVLGNLTLFLNVVNWATGRDNLVNIPPRPVERIQIVMSQEETSHLRLALLMLFPGSAAFCGIIIYWVRRK